MKKNIGKIILASALRLSLLAGCGSSNSGSSSFVSASGSKTAETSETTEAKDDLVSVNYRDIRNFHHILHHAKDSCNRFLIEKRNAVLNRYQQIL